MKFQFCDVFGLDPDLLMMVPQPCIALLLLFPINDKVAIPTNYHNFVKLELYRAHTLRACCAIYRSAFVVAWLYQGLIDPISPWLYGDISQNITESLSAPDHY